MHQERLPLSEKFSLSIKEASKYFGIGIKKIRQLPEGKKPCLSLHELEKQIGYDLDTQMGPNGRNMTGSGTAA